MVSTSIFKLLTIQTCIDKTAISHFMKPPTKITYPTATLLEPTNIWHNKIMSSIQYFMLNCLLDKDIPHNLRTTESTLPETKNQFITRTTQLPQFNLRINPEIRTSCMTKFNLVLPPSRSLPTIQPQSSVIYTEVEHTQLLCKKYTVPC